jgi:hypothetical protein
MKLFGTICPDPLLAETPVSPKIQSSFPLGSATLWPSSRDTDLDPFSYCDRTGVGLAVAGDALAGRETPIESADAMTSNTAITEKDRAAFVFHNNATLPTTDPPHGEAVSSIVTVPASRYKGQSRRGMACNPSDTSNGASGRGDRIICLRCAARCRQSVWLLAP